ncbi:MAG: D-aminoacyl-tRNA deacylase [Methermicoccaceae archaeon]
MEGEKFTVVCSQKDTASMNIERHLLELKQWHEVFSSFPSPIATMYESTTTAFRIVEVSEPLVYLDDIDTLLESIGVFSSSLVFASKHKSESTGRLLSAHYTGNPSEPWLGGRARELCIPATWMLKPILQSMRRYAEGTQWGVSMEATHHGPTQLHTPLVFAEIGSSEEQWDDEWAGMVVAKSILECTPAYAEVAIGFGGSHYPRRQTSLVLESGFTFGHCFSSHVLSELDEKLIAQALSKSNARFAYLDKKGMNAEMRARIGRMLEDLECIQLKEHEFYVLSVLTWDAYTQMLDALKRLGGGSVHVGAGMSRGVKMPMARLEDVWFASLPAELVGYVAKHIPSQLKSTLETSGVGYVLDVNGVPLPLLFAGERGELERHTRGLIETWIEMVSQRVGVERSRDSVMIKERRFDHSRARELGAVESEHLRKLSKGESVHVGGKTIKPDMVYRDINRVISTVFEITRGEIP